MNIRIKPADRGLIDQAARSQGKNRTEFVLDAARRAAEEALIDRSEINVGAQAYARFLDRLDEPPNPNERLRRALQTPAPRDEG